jgi:ribonuclease R
MGKGRTKRANFTSNSFTQNDVLDAFKKAGRKILNYKQVAGILKLNSHVDKQLLNAFLLKLSSENKILEVDRGKFQSVHAPSYHTGIVDLTSSGAAFVVCEGKPQDVYIHAKNTKGALSGDTVKFYLFPSRTGRREEGEIVEIITRAKSEFVGVMQVSDKHAFLVPDNNKMPIDIFIPKDELNGAKDGDKAIAKITNWNSGGKNPTGEVIKILGRPGNNNVEMHSILIEFGLPYEFPKNVEKEAEKINIEITEEEIRKRRDFRSTTTFTIDPFDAKDFDDALSLKKLQNNNWEIGIHIADVSHYVLPNTILDDEAVERATSVYLVDRVVPMLPEILSNNVCSLRPNEEKLCFSAVFEMTENSEVVNEWYGRTVINSNKRFTYEEAQEILEGKEGPYSEELRLLDHLAKKMRERRFKNGSIAFEKSEVKFMLDEKGNPLSVFFKVQKDSNHLIEEFMLLANRKVAELFDPVKKERKEKRNYSFVYRVHDLPGPDKLQDLSQFVYKFGYRLKTDTPSQVSKSLNKLVEDVRGKPEQNIIEQLAIRTMAKAVYTTKNIGHYGLGFDHYTHFTSPIRRYPDVLVHRQLQAFLDSKPGVNENELENLCKHSSDREKLAAEAERTSVKYKQVQFLKDKIGHVFKGVISGVTEWGIFVEIIENKCEGLVRMKSLTGDHFIFDEDNFCIRGKRTGTKYQLGDTVSIEIVRADLEKKQLDFVLVDY